MQKKLLGMAVAAALAVPTAVLAQSAVTISGTFKVGVDQIKIDNPCEGAPFNFFTGTGCSFQPAATGANRAGLKTKETRVTDNSSQIHFNVTEDLGGGMAGIAKLDMRFAPDEGGGTANASGNTWVGIRGAGFGTVTIGRHDLHYGKQPDDVPVKGALMASSVSLMDYAAAGTVAIANTTRTPNVVRWDSPAWGGFNITAAYSTSPVANEADMATGGTGGSAWNVNPSFTAPNFQIGFSMWDQKGDTAAIANEQESQVVYGFFRFGAFKVGAAYKMDEVSGNLGRLSKRKAWTVPVSWTAGRHTIAATYTLADDDDELGSDTGAKMYAAMYAFDFSKRTSISLTYAKIDNKAFAAYDLFTNCGATAVSPTTGVATKAVGAFGSVNSCSNLGEDPTLIAITLRHTF
jgi:predicted porin